MRALILVLAMAGPASAQTVTCDQAVSLAKTAGIFVETIGRMAEMCRGRGGTDPECGRLSELAKQHALSENMTLFATQAMSLAIQCPNED